MANCPMQHVTIESKSLQAIELGRCPRLQNVLVRSPAHEALSQSHARARATLLRKSRHPVTATLTLQWPEPKQCVLQMGEYPSREDAQQYAGHLE